MALERKDIRAKLDPDMHAALCVLCDVEGCDLGEFIERELVRVITKRVHAATVIAERTTRLGISGNGRELPGVAGK
jgi:hypothetical protein